MELDDIESLKLANATIIPCGVRKSLPRHRKGEKFLKGPIPLDWLIRAGKLPGKALHVANVIWFQAGIKNCRTIGLSSKILTNMGVKRNATYRGLTALEGAGLVSVIRHRGRLSEVTLLDVNDLNN